MISMLKLGRRAVFWRAVGFGTTALLSPMAQAVDSYRYLHVNIETPWMIFLFLLPMVLVPLVLMAGLYWYFAMRKRRGLPTSRVPERDGVSEGIDKPPEV